MNGPYSSKPCFWVKIKSFPPIQDIGNLGFHGFCARNISPFPHSRFVTFCSKSVGANLIEKTPTIEPWNIDRAIYTCQDLPRIWPPFLTTFFVSTIFTMWQKIFSLILKKSKVGSAFIQFKRYIFNEYSRLTLKGLQA